MDAAQFPSPPFGGEGGARCRRQWEGEGAQPHSTAPCPLPPICCNARQMDKAPMLKTSEKPAPKIGIAFGSGVARGWSHIGVLRRLREHGLEPDIISGTSIGALVGGCYAAGKLDELEDFARSLSGRGIFKFMDIRFNGSALFGGTKLVSRMQEHLEDRTIEGLNKKFVAVATDMNTGHEVWLKNGSLIEAIRASYALPGVFEPVLNDGRWLIDGALVNPVPISVCRAFDARLVIAVNLNLDAFGMSSALNYLRLEEEMEAQREQEEERARELMEAEEEEFFEDDEDGRSVRQMIAGRLRRIRNSDRTLLQQLFKREAKAGPGLTTVMTSSLNIVQDRLTRARMAADPPDIVIEPDVGHINLVDFDKADELITRGAEAADRAMPFIERALEQMG